MFFAESDGSIFIRLDPGEEIIEVLKTYARKHSIHAASISSGVGMVDGVEFGFYCIPKAGYDTVQVTGIHDLSSIQGNVTWLGDEPYPHVHITINDTKHQTLSGHVMRAVCHITMELVLHRLDNLNLKRKIEVGKPASRIEADIKTTE